MDGIQQAYMIEPDWQTGEGCWRYGVSEEGQYGTTTRYPSPLDVPIERLSYRDYLSRYGESYGVYDPKADKIILPSRVFAGYYTITHERCHALLGYKHLSCAGIYTSRRDMCAAIRLN